MMKSGKRRDRAPYCELCKTMVVGSITKHKRKRHVTCECGWCALAGAYFEHREYAHSPTDSNTAVEELRSVGEVLDALGIERSAIHWPMEELARLPNGRTFTPEQLRYFGAEKKDQPHMVDMGQREIALAGLDVMTLIIARLHNATAVSGDWWDHDHEMDTPVAKHALEFLVKLVAGHDATQMPCRWLNRPMDDVLDAAAYEQANRKHIQETYKTSATMGKPIANIVPRLGHVELHHDTEAGISTARAILRQHGQVQHKAVKLWIFYPNSEIGHLSGSNGSTTERMKNMKGGMFWIQMEGESMCVPAFTPHCTFTLESSYLVGQQFTLDTDQWLDWSIAGLRSELDADPSSAATRAFQLRVCENICKALLKEQPEKRLVKAWVENALVLQATFHHRPELWKRMRAAWQPYVTAKACSFCEELATSAYNSFSDGYHLEQHLRSIEQEHLPNAEARRKVNRPSARSGEDFRRPDEAAGADCGRQNKKRRMRRGKK